MTEKKSFYQPLFTAPEQRDLIASPLDPAALLTDEIDMVRVAIRRMFKLSKRQEPEEAIKTLAILSAVAGRLSSLIRIQEQLKTGSGQGGGSELNLLLENVLVEVQNTWNIQS